MNHIAIAQGIQDCFKRLPCSRRVALAQAETDRLLAKSSMILAGEPQLPRLPFAGTRFGGERAPALRLCRAWGH